MTTMTLEITPAAVLRAGRRVAHLNYSGRSITVLETGPRPARLGRVLPAGYTEGRRDSEGRYDAWTAKHPSVHVPSDKVIARDLTLEEAIEQIMKGAGG